jgi:hypothetical protein
MPKEVSHWVLAERTLDLIEPGPARSAIEAHPHFYYLGAIIYDSPYYAFGVRNTDAFLSVVSRLHGVEAEDTFEPYRGFARSYDYEIPPEALSFFAGALTHYSGDVVFHPFVNHFSGKYDDNDPRERARAQGRHRGLEGLMDIYFSSIFAHDTGHSTRMGIGAGLRNRGRLRRTLDALSERREMIEEVVGRFYWSEAMDIPVWDLLRRHAQIQRLFFKRLLGIPITIAGGMIGGGLWVVAATFYRSGIRRRARKDPETTLPFFSSPVTFTHPNTGDVVKGSVEDLAARMTTMGADLINSYQKLSVRGEAVRFLRNENGLSLEYGCDAALAPDPTHFSTNQSIRDLCRSPFRAT